MKTFEEIKELLIEQKPYLEQKYKVKQIGIFGSFVRGEQGENSDLDILVDYSENIGFFDLLKMEDELNQMFGIKVDLVMKTGLKKYIGQQILREVKYL